MGYDRGGPALAVSGPDGAGSAGAGCRLHPACAAALPAVLSPDPDQPGVMRAGPRAGAFPPHGAHCYHDCMISILDILAEQRIAEALERGELQDLPGAGRPLAVEDEPFVSAGQRMVNKILKNAGMVPEELSLRKELADLKRQIDAARQDEERQALQRRLAFLLLKLTRGR